MCIWAPSSRFIEGTGLETSRGRGRTRGSPEGDSDLVVLHYMW